MNLWLNLHKYTAGIATAIFVIGIAIGALLCSTAYAYDYYGPGHQGRILNRNLQMQQFQQRQYQPSSLDWMYFYSQQINQIQEQQHRKKIMEWNTPDYQPAFGEEE